MSINKKEEKKHVMPLKLDCFFDRLTKLVDEGYAVIHLHFSKRWSCLWKTYKKHPHSLEYDCYYMEEETDERQWIKWTLIWGEV